MLFHLTKMRAATTSMYDITKTTSTDLGSNSRSRYLTNRQKLLLQQAVLRTSAREAHMFYSNMIS